MKIRSGFVSNSSSSSFVILGDAIANLPEKFTKGIFALDREGGCEGQNIFELSKEVYDFLKNNDEYFDRFSYYEGIGVSGENSKTVYRDKLPSSFQVFGFEKDYYCTDTVELIKDSSE